MPTKIRILEIPLNSQIIEIELLQSSKKSYILRAKQDHLSLVKALNKWLTENIRTSEYNYFETQKKKLLRS
jgi:hypothetical protein